MTWILLPAAWFALVALAYLWTSVGLREEKTRSLQLRLQQTSQSVSPLVQKLVQKWQGDLASATGLEAPNATDAAKWTPWVAPDQSALRMWGMVESGPTGEWRLRKSWVDSSEGASPGASAAGPWSSMSGEMARSRSLSLSQWAPSYVELALRQLQSDASLPGAEVLLTTLLDPNRTPWVVLMLTAQRRIGLFQASDLQASLSPLETSLGGASIAVVSRQGFVLAHSTAQYLGHTLQQDSLFLQLAQKWKASADSKAPDSGSLWNLQQQGSFGAALVLPRTSAVVFVSQTDAELVREVTRLQTRTILFGLGVGFLLLAVGLWRSRRMAVQTEMPSNISSSASAGTPRAGEVPPTQPEGAPKIFNQQQRDQQLQWVVEKVSQEFESPVQALLARIRLSKEQASSAEEKVRLQQIEEQAKTSRELLVKLRDFAGAEPGVVGALPIRRAIEDSLQIWAGKIQQQKIRLVRELENVPSVVAAGDQFDGVLASVWQNSIEACERSAKKEIVVRLFSDSSGVVLEIGDSGVGMSPSTLERAREAFFSTKSGLSHLGLGLARVERWTRASHAKLELTSKEGEGTRLKWHFLVATDAVLRSVSKAHLEQAKSSHEGPSSSLVSASILSASSDGGSSSVDDVLVFQAPPAALKEAPVGIAGPPREDEVPAQFSQAAVEENIQALENLEPEGEDSVVIAPAPLAPRAKASPPPLPKSFRSAEVADQNRVVPSGAEGTVAAAVLSQEPSNNGRSVLSAKEDSSRPPMSATIDLSPPDFDFAAKHYEMDEIAVEVRPPKAGRGPEASA